MTRVLVLGATGMLGHRLWQLLDERHEAFATVRSSEPPPALLEPSRTVGGVSAEDPASVERALDAAAPQVVVNCIGIVKQAAAARDPIASITVNSLFPHRLAALCGARGARLIQISTDCVFSGRRGGYREDDVPDPVDLYGRSKLLGELGEGPSLTIRTSIIGRELAGANGLLEWFLAQRGTVRGFRRAIFSGLTTAALARVLEAVVRDHPALAGVRHLASEPISKHDLLCMLRDAYGHDVEIVADDEVACDRSLDGSAFVADTGIEVPSWPRMVADLAADATPYGKLRS